MEDPEKKLEQPLPALCVAGRFNAALAIITPFSSSFGSTKHQSMENTNMTITKRIEVVKYLCLFPGIFLIVSGLLILFFPNSASLLFDIKNIDTLKQPMALAMGIRQLSIGLMITVLVLSKQLKALGLIMLIGAIVPLTDFFIFSASLGWVSSLRHAAPVPLIFGLGIYLTYLTRKTE